MRTLRLILRGRLLPAALFSICTLSLCVFFALWLPWTLAPLFLLERLFALAAALLCAVGSGPAEGKTAKLLLILLLPWTGPVLSLVFTRRAPKTDFEATMSVQDTVLRGACPISEALCGLRACPAQTVEYFPTGADMAARLLSDLKGAKKSIYLQYYIIEEGVLWGKILSVLRQKAADGVDVRIIYDDFGCALRLPRGYEKRLRADKIKCVIARPLRFRRGSGRRDHRKIAVVDGHTAYTGGVNLADEYIGEKIRFGHWKDTAVRVTGAIAGCFSQLFATSWNALSPEKLSLEVPAAEGGKIPAAVLCDGADDLVRAGRLYLLRLTCGAEGKLYLFTPYLAPDEALCSALLSAARGSADVRLMIPRIPDKKLVFLVTRSFAEELSRGGVRIRMYTDGFLHAKSVISDGLVFVSSYNLDMRSLHLQAECGIVLKEKALLQSAERDFLSAWETGEELVPLGPVSRFFAKLLRLFAPLL